MAKRLLLRLWAWLPLPSWGRWALLWLLSSKFLAGVMAVIVDEGGRVLLFEHTYRPDRPWGLPAGWLKGGEDAARAIEREVFEESGITVRAVRPLMVGGDRKRPRLDLVFLCEVRDGAFRPSTEVSDARFFALDALPEGLEPYQRAIIVRAAAGGQGFGPDPAPGDPYPLPERAWLAGTWEE